MDLDFSPIEKYKENFIQSLTNLKKVIESHKLTFDEGINYLIQIWEAYQDYQLKYQPLGNLLNKIVRNKDIKPKPTLTKNIINDFLQADKKLVDLINQAPKLLKSIKQQDYMSNPSLDNGFQSNYLGFSLSPLQYSIDKKAVTFVSRRNRDTFSVHDLSRLRLRHLVYGSLNKYSDRLYLSDIEKPKIDDLFFCQKQGEYNFDKEFNKILKDKIKFPKIQVFEEGYGRAINVNDLMKLGDDHAN